jgi:SnoaL-like domain
MTTRETTGTGTPTAPADFDRIAAGYIAMWNAADPAERQAMVAEICAEDVRYTDPLVDVTGRDELAATIGAVQQQFPGFGFALHGAVDAHHDQARFGWELGPAGTPAPVAGFDVVTTDSGGKLTRVLGFLDRVPS